MPEPVDLSGYRVALLGGDEREIHLAYALAEAGAEVVTVGFVHRFQHPRIGRCEGLAAAVQGASAVIAPMSNTDEEGRIKAVQDPNLELVLDREAFDAMPQGIPFLIGVAKPVVRKLALQRGLRIVETAEVDAIAILNSIPTAEGALQLAMERLPVTIHGCHAAVIGFGRCGITLGRMLHALGARTVVVARNPAQLARAEEMGLQTADWRRLDEALGDRDVIFNTVPALVLDRPLLSTLRRDTLIIDIAAAPGGVDFAAAAELGIEAHLELGLPGRVAPRTAGRILAQTVPALLAEMLRD